MITKYKIFENSNSVFWYIPYSDKERVLFAIDKLNISAEIKNKIFSSGYFLTKLEKLEKKYIGVYFGKTSSDAWSYYFCNNKLDRMYSYKNFEKYNFKYMGKIEVNDYEMKAKKYNL